MFNPTYDWSCCFSVRGGDRGFADGQEEEEQERELGQDRRVHQPGVKLKKLVFVVVGAAAM